MDDIEKLLCDGVLGFYDKVEVTEIFATLPDKTTVNVFTIIVAENRNDDDKFIKPRIISEERIKVANLNGWSFGVLRYTLNKDEISLHLNNLKNSLWEASGEEQSVSNLVYQEKKFIPPDSFEDVSLNKVLKNNFWNGSYIIEWHDTHKIQLLSLLKDPPLLQALSNKISKYCPIALASVSDRLGNFILQIPVTIMQARFGHSKEGNNLRFDVVWHPQATPRPLRVSCEMEYDKSINGYGSFEVTGNSITIPMSYDYGLHKGLVWDDESNLILAATRPSSFIKSISLGMGIIENEPRTFAVNNKPVRISVQHKNNSSIGEPSSNQDSWIQKRLYREEKEQLTKQRKFVQYKPKQGKQEQEHLKAILDIRALIEQYGEKGVWLWDPYLSASDILETLFYCPYFGSQLKALTNLGNTGDSCASQIEVSGKTSQRDSQRDTLQNLDSNWYGVNLEFRARIGNSGWNFHDRFLIFPETNEGTLAWSLGTSVNSLGKQHHILQKVDDGQLIADSFLELWGELAKPEHLIWKP